MQYKDTVRISRGDRLTRKSYHQEFFDEGASTIAHENKPVLWKKRLEFLIETLRSARRGWALSYLVVNDSSKASGQFLSTLNDKQLIDPSDKLTLVVTGPTRERELEPADPHIRYLVHSGLFEWSSAPRSFTWEQANQQKDLLRETFDVVFVAAENASDLAAGIWSSSDASLVIANGHGAMFDKYAALEGDPDRPSFCYRYPQDLLQPLLTDGTEQSVQEYVGHLAACDKSQAAECPDNQCCPTQYVGELLLRSLKEGNR